MDCVIAFTEMYMYSVLYLLFFIFEKTWFYIINDRACVWFRALWKIKKKKKKKKKKIPDDYHVLQKC